MKNDQLPLFTGNKGNENHNEQHIMFPADFAEFSRCTDSSCSSANCSSWRGIVFAMKVKGFRRLSPKFYTVPAATIIPVAFSRS